MTLNITEFISEELLLQNKAEGKGKIIASYEHCTNPQETMGVLSLSLIISSKASEIKLQV